MTEVTTHTVRVRSVPVHPEPAGVGAAVRRASDRGIGTLALTGQAVAGALDRFWPGAPAAAADPSFARRLTKAVVGAALVTERRIGEVATAAELVGQQAVDMARRTPVVRDVLVGMDAAIDRWGEQAELETTRRERAVGEFVAALVPAVVDTILERIDFTAVMRRVPVLDIVAGVDLDAVLARIDLNAVLARVDLDALLATVDVEALLDRIDVDGLLTRIDVAALMGRVDVDALLVRVDVDGLMGRVDLDRLMARIDLGPIVERVLAEVDVGGIVRESTGSITNDAMDSARISAMRLDSFVARVADRVLLRGGGVRVVEPEADEP